MEKLELTRPVVVPSSRHVVFAEVLEIEEVGIMTSQQIVALAETH
jgi:hypothetical protein